eukprot:scaffold70236_cov57-Attheya_sp.AAC.1
MPPEKRGIEMTDHEHEDEHEHEEKNKEPESPREERKREAQERKSLAYTEGIAEESLEDRAGVVSDWLLSYLTPLLRQGASKVLEQEDVGVPSKRDEADLAFALVQVTWKAELQTCDTRNKADRAKYDARIDRMSEARRKKAKPFRAREPSVYKALVAGFGGWKVVFAIFLYIISALLTFIPVLILEDLVKFFEAGGTTDNYQGYMNPWGLVAILAVLPVFVSVLQTRNQVIMAHCAVFVRTAVSTLLYEKSLTVSAGGRARTSTGQVVNMMSNDTTQLQRFLQFVGMTIVAPLQIIVSLVLIYGQVGNATWVGVGFMVFLAPINIVVFSIVGKMRRKVLKYSDLRVKMMNEILNGIRIIKFYAWEKPFAKEVAKLRDAELRALTKMAYVSAIGFSMVLLSAPIIQPILVFLTYINIQDEPLSASTAFTTVALFNIMRFPFAFMPMGLLQYIQSKISLRRLGTYLLLPELQPYAMDTPHPDHAADPNSPGCQVGSVTMKDSSFSWVDPKAPPPPPEKVSKKERRKSRRSSSTKGGDTSMASSVHSLQSQYSAASMHNGEDEEQNGNPPDNITLRDITCTIEAGSLVAVVGTVGSGKSSFLSAILGEMEALNDSKVYIPRPESVSSSPSPSTSNDDEPAASRNFMSYCSQSPWVVNDTLRDNVLFGRPFDQDRYDQVLQACALNDDLSVLPAGDMTEIGERGINLSGGQKARVSLARAMYATETRILLLDDPLSAVDAHVGEHLFRHALTGDISKGKTRILVTHHVHFLPRCDKVIVLKRGSIAHVGTYQECIDAGVDFAGAVDVSKGTNPKPEIAPPSDVKASKDTFEDEDTTETAADEKKTETEKQDMVDKGKTLMSAEEREEGHVDGSAYLHYMRVGGVYIALLAIFIQGLGRACEIMSSFWLAIWAKASTEGVADDDPLTDSETTFYLNIYALFGMLGVLALTIRALLLAVHRLRASRKLHVALTDSIMRAPVAFFDVTPTGRVLNRFAADMDKADLELTQSLGQGFSTVFSVLGAVGAIVVATKGVFLVPLVPIGYVYYLIQKWFRRTSTELQRLTSIANSPIFADFSQTLSGTPTIRAYGEQGRFFAHCRSSFDKANASYLLVQLSNYWLGLRLDCLGGLIGAFVGGLAVATASTNFIPAGYLGLALSYAIEVTNFLKHGVRMMATVEAQMNSVERILYYSENIEREAPDVIPEKDPDPTTWPSAGCLEFKNISMRYRDGPLVLKDISFNLRGGEKIGVCGRTGSGKSSLMIALFRICEPEPDGGSIIIDGVNTSEIGTSALRLNLSIIPQDPVMFSNSVRYNLDPFGASTDLELWTVLGKVQLAEVIAALPKGLDQEVAEGGENFSQGQRQLLCIARSLLRNPKVLIMDEATASIDNETDALIQTMYVPSSNCASFCIVFVDTVMPNPFRACLSLFHFGRV